MSWFPGSTQDTSLMQGIPAGQKGIFKRIKDLIRRAKKQPFILFHECHNPIETVGEAPQRDGEGDLCAAVTRISDDFQ